MITRQQCLREMDAAAEAAKYPQSAYQVRTRMKRALLSCVRRVAQLHGLREPGLTGRFAIGESADLSPRSVAIVEICNELNAEIEHLCQPSESLDTRWTDGWEEAIGKLIHLRSLI